MLQFSDNDTLISELEIEKELNHIEITISNEVVEMLELVLMIVILILSGKGC